jgi:hypothetical protein
MGRKKRGYPTLRFRVTVLQRLAPMISGLIGIVGAQLYFWIAHHLFYADVTLHLIIFTACGGFFGSMIGSSNYGVTLTPWTVEVHNLRRRVIWLRDVRLIRVEKSFLSRKVAIYEFSGRCTTLRAPITGFLFWDKRFEEKYHAIGRWWLDHREIGSGDTEPQDTPPAGFLPIGNAAPSMADTVAGAVPPRSPSRLRRRNPT